MKKIVYVMEQLSGGGAERVTAAIANEVCKEDYEVHIVTYNQDFCLDYDLSRDILRHNMGEIPADMNRLEKIFYRMKYLRGTIQGIEPDCVISLAIPRTVILLRLALLGIRTSIIFSERNDPKRFPAKRWVRVLRNFAYVLSDGVIFQTAEAQSYFSSIVQRKSVVIPNPILSKLPDRYEGVREKTIVNWCRYSPQKNLDLLIDAFSDVCDEFPEYTLHIYGEGPDKRRLSQKVQENALASRVFLHDYQKNIHDIVWKSALYVSSSDYEGISNSMLEALAMGIPCICTDCPAGGARSTIRHGENGLLVPVGDRSMMAEAIRAMLSNTDLAVRCATEGVKLKDSLDIAKVVQCWIQLIESVLKNDKKDSKRK